MSKCWIYSFFFNKNSLIFLKIKEKYIAYLIFWWDFKMMSILKNKNKIDIRNWNGKIWHAFPAIIVSSVWSVQVYHNNTFPIASSETYGHFCIIFLYWDIFSPQWDTGYCVKIMLWEHADVKRCVRHAALTQLVRFPSRKCEGANRTTAWIIHENEKNSAIWPTLAVGF